jgi:copper ion binding protein
VPQLTLSVPEISCAHCQQTIEGAVGQLPGVASVQVDIPTKQVHVAYADPADRGQVTDAIEQAGYDVEGDAGVVPVKDTP